MITDTAIRIFLSLSETLNFTETAKKMYLTQQGVSKQIAHLEKELGYRLFVRSTRNVSLTPSGANSARYFRRMLDDMSEFVALERASQLEEELELRIGFNNWLSYGEAPSIAQERLTREYPTVSFFGERHPPDLLLRNLRERTFGLILVLKRFILDSHGFEMAELTNYPMSILISSRHAILSHAPTLEELSAIPLLINSFEGETQSDTITRATREAMSFGLEPQKIIVTPNRDSVYTNVEMGAGIAIACAASQVIANAQISTIPLSPPESLVAVWMADSTSPVLDRYVALLREAFSLASQPK